MSGGDRDPEVTRELADAGAVTEPAQDHRRMSEAGQRADTPWSTTPAALRPEQMAKVPTGA